MVVTKMNSRLPSICCPTALVQSWRNSHSPACVLVLWFDDKEIGAVVVRMESSLLKGISFLPGF